MTLEEVRARWPEAAEAWEKLQRDEPDWRFKADDRNSSLEAFLDPIWPRGTLAFEYDFVGRRWKQLGR
jgi:hypothetical protein